MANTVIPTTSTFTSVQVATYQAAGTLGARNTLDLTARFGATLLCRIGRQVQTALTRAAYVMVRRSNNNTGVVPFTGRDCVSTIAAATATNTTLSAANSIGDSTSAITAIGAMAVGDIVSLHTSGPPSWV